MLFTGLRALAKLLTATTGLLLFYEIVFAMEGITTRIAMNSWKELALAIVWTLPWTLLMFSGLEDVHQLLQSHLVTSIGVLLTVTLLFYFERGTTSGQLTKYGMPILATAAGLLPYGIRQIRFLYVVIGLAAGVGGAFVCYHVARMALSSTTSFADREITVLLVLLAVSGLLSAALSLWQFLSTERRRA